MALSKIQSESINLADTFAFTGTVTGTPSITEFDLFRLTTDFSGNQTAITNVERQDTGTFEKIGTGVTESSGVFSFASTGKYLVTGVANFVIGNSAEENDQEFYLDTTVDNGSNYVRETYARIGMDESKNPRNAQAIVQTCVDVTDTSQVKVKFAVGSSSSNVSSLSSTNANYTYFTFMRIGDT
jgi:hypothetical protein